MLLTLYFISLQLVRSQRICLSIHWAKILKIMLIILIDSNGCLECIQIKSIVPYIISNYIEFHVKFFFDKKYNNNLKKGKLKHRNHVRPFTSFCCQNCTIVYNCFIYPSNYLRQKLFQMPFLQALK